MDRKKLEPKKQLIVFGEDWGRFPSSTQHLIHGLLNLGWSVIWINSVGMRKPSFQWSYVKRLFEKLYQYIFAKTKQHQLVLPDNLTVISPMILPFMGNSFTDRLNRAILTKQLSSVMKKGDFVHPILWLTLPTAYPFISIFDKCPLVYYCCDDYALLVDPPNPQVTIFEKQLIEKADLILVVSDVLAKNMPAHKTYILDQGVDLTHFMKKYDRPNDLPNDKPIAGFYGSLTHWVDIDLLYQCASQLTDWNFVVIGSKSVDISHLEKLNNFFYLGPKSYSEIPAYSQYWDVGLIPFIKNQLVMACNPLKAKEYLVGGKPIVSVAIPALDKYKEYIYLAKNNKDFIHGIEQSLNDTKETMRKNYAAQEGWDSRALVLENKLIALHHNEQ
ncbi:MAG: glycosyltransferase [Legionella sp.]